VISESAGDLLARGEHRLTAQIGEHRVARNGIGDDEEINSVSKYVSMRLCLLPSWF